MPPPEEEDLDLDLAGSAALYGAACVRAGSQAVLRPQARRCLVPRWGGRRVMAEGRDTLGERFSTTPSLLAYTLSRCVRAEEQPSPMRLYLSVAMRRTRSLACAHHSDSSGLS